VPATADASADVTAEKTEVSMGVVLAIVASLLLAILVMAVFLIKRSSSPPLPQAPPVAHQQPVAFVNPAFEASPPLNDKIYDHVGDKSEIYNEVCTKNPLAELSAVPTFTLEDAAAQGQVHCGGDLQKAVKSAFVFAGQLAADNKLGPLSVAEAAAIHLYSQDTPLYQRLNAALGDYGDWGKRASLHHYLPYIKLLRAALLKLPPQTATIVYRGSKCPLQTLIPNATVGKKVVWWSFTSTSRSKDTRKKFITGKPGTLYQISSNDGRDISRYSKFGAEEELLLLPGSQFVIDHICLYGNNDEVWMNQLTPEDAGTVNGVDDIYATPLTLPIYNEEVYATYAGGSNIDANNLGSNTTGLNGIDMIYGEGSNNGASTTSGTALSIGVDSEV
jgi:hypothetical protein